MKSQYEPSHRRLTPEAEEARDKKILELLDGGCTAKAIAPQFRLKASTILVIAHKHGSWKRGPYRKHKHTPDRSLVEQ